MINDSEVKQFVRERIFGKLDFWGVLDGSRIGISIFGGKFLIYNVENNVWQEYDEIPNVQMWLSLDIKFGERIREYIGARAPEHCYCIIAVCLYFPKDVNESEQEKWVNRLDETFRYVYYRTFRVTSSVRLGLGGDSSVRSGFEGDIGSSIYKRIVLNYNCTYLSIRTSEI